MNKQQPVAHTLCYTLRKEIEKKGKTASIDKDKWEIFWEDDNSTPLEQAQARVKELEEKYDGEKNKWELYSWNIARLTDTSDHYTPEKPQPVFDSKVTLYNLVISSPFDDTEVHPLANASEVEGDTTWVIVDDEAETEMWGVYVHTEQGIECVADCNTRETAEALADMLLKAGRFFTEKFDVPVVEMYRGYELRTKAIAPGNPHVSTLIYKDGQAVSAAFAGPGESAVYKAKCKINNIIVSELKKQ